MESKESHPEKQVEPPPRGAKSGKKGRRRASRKAASPGVKGKAARNKPAVRTDIGRLDESERNTLDQMLEEGGTIDDVVEAFNERAEKPVSMKAVETYFRSNLVLQQKRVRRQVETARVLKEALTHPESAQAELAESALLLGLMGLNRKAMSTHLQSAARVHDRHLSQGLRQQQLDLQRQLAEERLQTERAKRAVIKTKLEEMRRLVEIRGSERNMGPELLQKIREIYGLTSDSAPPM